MTRGRGRRGLGGAWASASLLGALAAIPLAGAYAATTTVAAPPTPSTVPFYGSTLAAPVAPGSKMLVESDQLVYDYDHHTVAAVGHARIYYGQYTLLADKITYDEVSGRLIADGHVLLTDPMGNQFKSDHVDVTANFRDAFVASLRVDTPQQTHFSAESAERTNGQAVTFTNGSYTACEVCEEHPEKPPLWNVKATKIVVDQKEHTVAFTNAELEFFGRPVAWFPAFTIADPSISRKTGLLWPIFSYSNKLGFGVRTPYFWAIAPSYDLTLTPSIYSRQGFLGDAEWRQRLDSGIYSIEAAGIDQRDKAQFDPASASYRDLRGGVRTIGAFDINRMWGYGWDATLLSDRTFTRDYHVVSGEGSLITSYANLTGVGDRNYFDLRAEAFQVLTEKSAAPATNPGKFDQGRQAYVVPVMDYNRVSDDVAGGALTLTSNLTSLDRSADDTFKVGPATYYAGTAGTTVRATQQVAWTRQDVSSQGSVFAPFLYLRGDAYFLNANTAAPTITGDPTAFRAMPAAGLTWSYPLLARAPGMTSIFEPKVQLVVRPNEVGIGSLPNNDSLSLVYEVANLFDADKFSGWDRSEGGSRLNFGLHYNGAFANGAAIDGTFGQSYQLLGLNSFAVPDVANVGPNSGLESRRSDYVGGVTLDTGLGPSLQARGRFDQNTFVVNRAELEATAALGPVTASAAYFYLRQAPNLDLGLSGPASVVHGAASVNVTDAWRAFGSFAYDVAKAAIASDSVGVAFDNSCLTLAITYNETRKNYTDITPDRSVNFRLELRTLGQGSVNANLSNL